MKRKTECCSLISVHLKILWKINWGWSQEEKKHTHPVCELPPDRQHFKTAATHYKVPEEISQQRVKQLRHFITSVSFFLGAFVAVWYFPNILLRKVPPSHSETKAGRPASQDSYSCCSGPCSKHTESARRCTIPTQIGGTRGPLVIFYLEKASSKWRSGFTGTKTILIACATMRRRLRRECCEIITFHRRFNLLKLWK